MIKRASTILLTLFLLLTSAQVWGADIVVNFTNSGASTIQDLNYPSIIKLSAGSNSSINNNGLVLKKGSLLKFELTNASSSNPKYQVTVVIGSNNNAEFRFIATKQDGGTTYNPTGQEWGKFTGTKTFDTYCKGTSASFSIEINNNADASASLVIKSITISGEIKEQIVCDKKNIYEGENATFTAYGVSGTVDWFYQEEGSTNRIPLGTGQSITTSNLRNNGTMFAIIGSKTLKYPVIVGVRCSGTLTPDVIETFKLNSGTEGQFTNLSSNLAVRTSYSYYTDDGNSEVKEKEYKIATSTAGTWPGWLDNGNPIKGRAPEGASNDESNGSFLMINCGLENFDTGDYIFKLKIDNLCDYTTYNFSADVMNICQENNPNIAQVNILFLAYGISGTTESANPIGRLETDIIQGPNPTWRRFNTSVRTGQYTSVVVYIYNNIKDAVKNSNNTIAGNDVGIDNITFSRCTPEVGVYTENPLTTANPKISTKACNNGSEFVTLYIGNPEYSLNKFMQNGHYILQMKNSTTGGWVDVIDENTNSSMVITDKGYAEYKVKITSGQPDTEYRGIVASKLQAALDLKTKDEPDLKECASYFKMKGNFASVKMACTNTSVPPTLKSHASCAPEDGKFDLNNLITKINLYGGASEDISNLDLAAKKAKIATLGTIEWFKEDNTPSPSVIDFPTSSDNPGKYYAKFTQKDPSIVYSISGNSDVASVSLLETITFAVTPLAGYKGCISEIGNEHSFEIENIKPTESAIGDYKFTWMSVNEDGSFNEANPLQTSGTTYELPLVSGKGKIVVKAVSNSDAACPGISDPVEYDLAADPKFEYVGANIPCKDQLKEDGVVINLKEISGSTQLKIKRTATDENNKVSETIFTSFDKTDAFKVINLNNGDTEYAFKDTYFDAQYFSADFDANKIAFVQYDIVLGIETTECKVEYSTETFGISSTNIFSLIPSINVVNISKNDNIVDFHVCEGELVTVESNYNAPSGLKAGEIYKWYVNDVLVEGDDAANSKSYTIEKIEDTTIIKVELDKDPKVADAKTCGGSATITINVDEMPKIQSKDVYICEDDADGIQLSVTGGEKYKWSPTTGLSAADISNPIANVSKTTTYTVDVYKGQCKNDTTVVVNVNNLPEITSIEPVSDEEKGNMVVTIVKEVGDTYSYSLDGENYAELPIDNIIKDLPIGWSLLYIKNDTTTCVNSKEFYIAPIEIKPDKFFSPNGDGNNDKWEVEHLNSYDSYIVEIFDRHSKRLFIQRVGSFNIGGTNTVDGDEFEGWNGEYNGKPMPSDDYWYLITVEDIRKQYTGHFTLKR